MSMASSNYPSLCSTPSLPTNTPTKQNTFLSFPIKYQLHLSPSFSINNKLKYSSSILIIPKASSSPPSPTESNRPKPENGGGQGEEEVEKYEEYEVELDQPYGLKFAKGGDGGTYIDGIAQAGTAYKTGKFEVGDRVIATRYVHMLDPTRLHVRGRVEIISPTLYGHLKILQLISHVPNSPCKTGLQGKSPNMGKLTDKEILRAERNTGNVSTKLREIQMQNYLMKMEQKQNRANDLREGLKLYKENKYEEALEKFESVLGSKPELDEGSVASYNVACCYSKLNRLKAGISALEDALKAGYEDFNRIRTDPDLTNIRTSPDFDPLMKRFDESFINESAINAIKSIFGIFNKK